MTKDYAKSIVPTRSGFRLRLRWLLLLVAIGAIGYMGQSLLRHRLPMHPSATHPVASAGKTAEKKGKSAQLPLPKAAPTFDFYTVLPKRHDLLPSHHLSEQDAAALPYALQVIASRDLEAVKRLQEKLALLGFDSKVWPRGNQGDREDDRQDDRTLYRLLVGAYANKTQAKDDQDRLQENGIESVFYNVKSK